MNDLCWGRMGWSRRHETNYISIIALVGAVVGIWSAFEYSMHCDEYRKRVEATLAEYVKTGLYVFGRVHVRVKKLG